MDGNYKDTEGDGYLPQIFDDSCWQSGRGEFRERFRCFRVGDGGRWNDTRKKLPVLFAEDDLYFCCHLTLEICSSKIIEKIVECVVFLSEKWKKSGEVEKSGPK